MSKGIERQRKPLPTMTEMSGAIALCFEADDGEPDHPGPRASPLFLDQQFPRFRLDLLLISDFKDYRFESQTTGGLLHRVRGAVSRLVSAEYFGIDRYNLPRHQGHLRGMKS